MIRKLVVLVSLLMCVLPLSVRIAAGQSIDAPLVVYREGNLYALYDDGREQQLTDRSPAQIQATWLERSNALMSPNGRYLAYADVVEFYADAWNNQLLGNIGDFVRDIYVIDLTTGRPFQVTRQEASAAYDRPSTLIYHSLGGGRSASWSPDGTQLAFYERRGSCEGVGDYCHRIVVFDATTGESQVIAQDIDDRISVWLWTDNGLLIGSTLVDPADGTVLANNYYNSGYVPQYALQYDGREYVIGAVLGFPNTDGDLWYLFDVRTGEYYRTTAYLTVVSAAARDTSLMLVDYDNDTRPRAVYNAAGNQIARPPAGPPYAVDYMLSLDGTQYAYSLTANGRSVVGDVSGAEVRLPGEVEVVAWGTPVYTLFHPDHAVVLEPTLDPYTESACGTLPPVALTPGGVGRVLPGSPNRVRSIPRIEGEPIGSIPAGATFNVLAGQPSVCGDGLRWVRVEYEGVTGWTAEGVDGDVFLEPVN